MKFKLKTKYIYIIVLPILLLFLLMYMLIFPSIMKYSTQKTETIQEQSAKLYSKILNDKFLLDIDMLKSLKVSIENFNPENYDANSFQKELLKYQIKNKKDISSAWYLFDDGNDIKIKKYTKKNNEIKYKTKIISSNDFYKGIYKSLKKNQKNYDLYIYKSKKNSFNNALIFTVVCPVYFNSEVLGIIGFDFTIKNILKTNTKLESLDKTSLLLAYNNEIFDLNYSFTGTNFKKNDIEGFILNSISKNNYLSSYDDIYNIRIKPLGIETNTNKLFLIIIEEETTVSSFFKNAIFKFALISVIIILFILFVSVFFIKRYSKRLYNTYSILNSMATGEISEIKELNISKNDDISKINISINKINENLDNTAAFIKEIASGNLDFEYIALAEDDNIGKSLINLREKLKQTKTQEIKRQKEDERLKWATEGASKFSEIIREHSDNLEELSYAIISDLVNYIGANQGGLFIINEDKEDEHFIQLLASYAYNRRKMLRKEIPMGVGLVGRCILEKETIFMTKIPKNYLSISSGLGEENPASLLIVPLIFHEEVFGVVELASFSGIEKHKVEFVEHIAESIASAISMVKINVRTVNLLNETKIKSEETASQEEEIRQNIEEMAALTDELNTKLENTERIFDAVNSVANIAQFNMNGRITDISDSFLTLLQKERKDIIGKVQGSFSNEAKNPDSFKKFWYELKKGNKMEFEQILTIKGELLRINSKYIPLKNNEGKVYKVISYAEIL